jgi:hypothetical protein
MKKTKSNIPFPFEAVSQYEKTDILKEGGSGRVEKI